MRRWSSAALLALLAFAPPAASSPLGDGVTVAGVRFVVAHQMDRTILSRADFSNPSARESSTQAERISASSAIVPDLASTVGLHGPRDGFDLDSVSLVQHLADRVVYHQVHDGIVIAGGFAQIAIAKGGLVYEIEYRVEPFPEHIQPRPLSGGKALALAIKASGRPWDGTVLSNHALYGRLSGPGPIVYHQVRFGTLRKSGRREDWEVYLTPDGHILYNHTGDKY